MVCIQIEAKTIKKAIIDIRSAEKIADLIEIRLDCINKINEKGLEQLIRAVKKPIIITDQKNRIKLFRKAIELKADYIDISLENKDIINKIEKNKTKIICSYSDSKKTPNNLDDIYKRLKKIECDVIKITTKAQALEDNLMMLKLIHKSQKKIIAFCTGKLGQISRIMSVPTGGLLTFASLEQTKEMKNIYKADRLKRGFKIYGLIGNPVNKSKGFLLFNTIFDKLQLNSIYLNFLVEDLDAFMKMFKGYFRGLSITMPFKSEIIPFLNTIDTKVKSLQAVNVVVEKRGKLFGSNTDMIGGVKAIEDRIDLKGKKALLIGAGGVSRALAFGLKEKGVDLIIVNRTKNKAVKLADEVDCNAADLSVLKKIKDIDILINGTSLGMSPNILKTPVNKNQLRKIMKKDGLVFDSIYNPIKTKLLKDAEALGLKAVSGLELFINQAALQFELWTGKKVSTTEMKKILS